MRFVALLFAVLATAACSAGDPPVAGTPAAPATATAAVSPFGRDLSTLGDADLCEQALTDDQQAALAVQEVTPYTDDDGTTSCYYLMTPGESDVNEGFSVTVYRSSRDLRSAVSADSGGTLPRPVTVVDLPGAEQVEFGDASWSAGITVAADAGAYVHLSSWAPDRTLDEDELTGRTLSFAGSVVTNLRRG